MPIEVELYDGTILEFPDDTPDDVILAAGRRETENLNARSETARLQVATERRADRTAFGVPPSRGRRPAEVAPAPAPKEPARPEGAGLMYGYEDKGTPDSERAAGGNYPAPLSRQGAKRLEDAVRAGAPVPIDVPDQNLGAVNRGLKTAAAKVGAERRQAEDSGQEPPLSTTERVLREAKVEDARPPSMVQSMITDRLLQGVEGAKTVLYGWEWRGLEQRRRQAVEAGESPEVVAQFDQQIAERVASAQAAGLESLRLSASRAPETKEFFREVKDESTWDTLKRLGNLFVSRPTAAFKVASDISMESMPQSMAIMAAALMTRGAAPAALAGGSASAVMEAGNSYVENRLKGEDHDTAWRNAVKGGIAVGVFDGVAVLGAGGAARNILAQRTLGSQLAAAAKETAKQMPQQAVLGMGGEAFKQLATGSTGEQGAVQNILAEGLGEMAPGSAVTDIVGASRLTAEEQAALDAEAARSAAMGKLRDTFRLDRAMAQERQQRALEDREILSAETPEQVVAAAERAVSRPNFAANAIVGQAMAWQPAMGPRLAGAPQTVVPTVDGQAAPGAAAPPLEPSSRETPAPAAAGAGMSSPVASISEGTTITAVDKSPEMQGLPVDKPADLQGAPQQPGPSAVDEGAHQAAASPTNDRTETPAQIEANNRKLGHATINGLGLSVENPEGSVRQDIKNDPPKWRVTMTNAHYGYWKGTKDNTGEHVDAYVKPGTPDNYSGTVYVIDQIDPATGKFDEFKTMVGYGSREEAERTYDAHFDDGRGPQRRGAVTPMPWDQFRAWVESDGPTRAVAYRQPQNAEQPQQAPVAESQAPVSAPGEAQGEGRVTPAPAPAVPQSGPRSIGRMGKMPNQAADVELRTNADGTLTPYSEGRELLDYDSGDPIRLPADITDQGAREAIKKAGAVPSGARFFTPKEAALVRPPKTQDISNLDDARRALADVRAKIAKQGRVVDDRLLTRERQLAAIVRELEQAASADSQPATPPAAPAPAPRQRNEDRNGRTLEVGENVITKGGKYATIGKFGTDGDGKPMVFDTDGRAIGAPGSLEYTALAPRGGKTSEMPDTDPRKFKPIGVNAEGNQVLEDGRGVRAYISNGVRQTERVKLEPGGGVAIDRDGRSSDFKTTEEVAAERPAASPASNAPEARNVSAGDAGTASLTHAGRPYAVPIEVIEVEKWQDTAMVRVTKAPKGTNWRDGMQMRLPLSSLTVAPQVDKPAKTQAPAVDKPAEMQESESATGSAPTVSANTVFTEDAAAAARERLRKKLRSQLSSGIDPELLQDGITLAGYHIEAGARSFAAYTKAMLDDLGDAVKPYLKSWYLAVRFDPRATDLARDMTPTAEVEAADVDALTERVDAAPAPADTATEEPTDGPDRQPESVSPRDPAEGGTDAAAGASNRQSVDDGVAGSGASPAEGGRVPASPADAGAGGTRRAGRVDRKASGAARDRDGGGAESGATDDFDLSGEDIGRGGLTKKYRDNIAAIKVIKALEAEGRKSTADERKTLARYVGWGALKGVFDPQNKQWAKEHEELKGLLTDAEFKAARASTRNAHFTSPTVVNAMFDALGRMGVTRGRILEPSVGVGNFFGLMPAALRKASQLFGVELDPLTARIAAGLYPSATVRNQGFEEFDVPAGYFDVVIANPPFGDEPIVDSEGSPYSGWSIHNYFLAKAIDKLRDGGVMAVVVSHNFMDAQNPRVREWIAARADLIGAVRLPRTAFKENAGTEVVTDILVFQKNSGAQRSPDWLQVVDQTNSNPKTGDQVTHKVNRYFVDNPEAVLGTPSAAGTMYRANEYTVDPSGDLAQQLANWADTLPVDIYTPIDRTQKMAADAVPDGVKVGSYFVGADGKVMVRGPDEAGDKTALAWEAPNEKARERMLRMIRLREALRAQMRLERDPQARTKAIEDGRAALNRLYDEFRKLHGYLNDPTNRRLFVDDTEASLLLALEFDYDRGVSDAVAERENIEPRKPSAKKADIFERRVLFPPMEDVQVASARDAMLASLNFKGTLDLAYMSRMYGKSEDAIVEELGDLVFREPDGTIVAADEYLSGDVKTKLAEAERAARGEPSLKRNVEALRKVIPADKKPSQIHAALGAKFVPGDVLTDFVKLITGARARAHYVRATGQWILENESSADPALNTGKWGTPRMPAYVIIQQTMAGKAVVVTDTYRDADGNTRTMVNQEQTDLAREKQAAIKNEWQSWLWSDPDRSERLAKVYNEEMNRWVERKYDGSFLTLPGKVPDEVIELLPHQKAGVWRALQSRQVLLDHVVGAGKTFQMVAIAMELRRMGIARKPFVAVPNHLTLQWRSEFARMYPAANVLAATPDDFAKGNRERFFSKIVTGDWDAVIVGHSSLKKIGLPPETEKAILSEQVAELAAAIEQIKRDRGDRNIIRDMEGIKKRLEAKLKEKLNAVGKRDKVVTFDELGVDAIFVDELHEFKNLYYHSTMDRVAGLGNPTGSHKAFDLFVKLQWLFETFGDQAPIIGATGTPVSNSLVEMYNMQRFLQYPQLKAEGLHVFDAWARQFGSVESVYEVSPSGTGYRSSTRFSKFKNLGALMAHYNSFADVVTLDDLKLQEEARGKRFPVPKLRTGRPINVVAERSPQVANVMGVPRLEVADGDRVVFGFNPMAGERVTITQEGEKFKVERVVPTDSGQEIRYSIGTAPTEQDARMKVVEAGLSPKITVDPESILGKFGRLRELTRQSKGKVNALSLTGLANKAGLDYRLVDPFAPDFPGSKINMAVANMLTEYRRWGADRGTQLVFCDLSVPLSERDTLASKARRLYVREDGTLVHKKGTMHTVEGFEELPFFVVPRGTKEAKRHDVYDAASGVLLRGGDAAARTKAEAIDFVAGLLRDEEKRQRWIDARESAGEIQQEAIDEYNDANEIDTEETEAVTLQDIAGVSAATKFSVYDDIKAKLLAAGVPESEVAFIHDYSTPTAKDKLFKAVKRGDVRFLLGSTPKMGAGTNVQDRLVALHHIDAPWRPSDLEQREGRIIRRGNKLYERDPENFEVGIYRYATKQTYDTRRWQILEHKAAGIEQLRNYDGMTDEIDDVDGEAANAAEMKAAASGDPMILRETQLRNEVKRLENMERGHADQVQELLRQARYAEDFAAKFGPRQVATIEERVATTEKHPVPEKGLPTGTEVNGREFTDKVELTRALAQAFSMVASSAVAQRVPVIYRGLEFSIRTEGGSAGSVTLTAANEDGALLGLYNKKEAISASGALQRISNYVDRLPERAKELRAQMDSSRENAKRLRAQAAEPFAQADDLKNVRAEHRKVQRLLIARGPEVPEAEKPMLERALHMQREALRQAGYGDALDELMAGTEEAPANAAGVFAPRPENAASGDDVTVEQEGIEYGDADQPEAPVLRPGDVSGGGRRGDGLDLRRLDTRVARVPGANRPSILAKGLADEFERAGVAALTGKTVTSADDVAALAQVWRDPRYETMRVVYVDDAGKIVHATAVSSRLPDRSAAFPMGETAAGRGGFRIRETMREHGATGYYLLHNHPSGDPSPSPADEGMTARVAAMAAGFLGHVVINSNRYAVIDPQGNTEVKRRDFGLDKLLTAAQPSDLLGMPVRNPVDVARIGKALQRPDMVGVIMQSGTAGVRVLAEMPVQLLDNRLKAAGWLRRMATNSGSEAVFLAVPEVPTGARRANVEWLLDNGFVSSAVTTDGFWKIARSKEERRNLPKFGRRKGQELLQVEQASSVTDSAAFSKWFGDSKVVDENGEPLVVYRSAAVDSVLSGQAQVAESGVNGLRGNAELLSNLFQGPTFRLKGLGGFDTPTQRVVLAAVRSFGLDPKVLRSVVELVPVDMVNILAREKLSAESLFRNDAVLKKLLSADRDGSVAAAVDVADALAAAVTGVTAKDARLVGFLGGALENEAASGTRHGYLAVSAHGLDFKPIGNRGTFDPESPSIVEQEGTPFDLDNLGDAAPAELSMPDFRARLAGARQDVLYRQTVRQVDADGVVLNVPGGRRISTQEIRNRVLDQLQTSKTFNWLDRTLSTQYHKASKDPQFARVFNIAQRYLDDVSRLASTAADLAPAILPKLHHVSDLARRGARAADLDRASQVLFESTLENAAYTDEELLAKGLTERQAELYRQFRASIDASLDTLAVSEMARLVTGIDADMDAARAMLRAETDPRRAAETLAALLSERIDAAAREDDGDRAMRLDDTRRRVQRVAKKIAKLKREGYAPLMRFGRYALAFDVRVDDEGATEYGFMTFETEAERNKMARDMEASEGFTNVRPSILSDEAYKLMSGIDPNSLEVFGNAVQVPVPDGAGGLRLDTLANQEVFQQYLKAAVANRSALKRLIRRKGVKGFSEDGRRVLAAFLTSNARLAAQNYNMRDLVQAAQDIDKRKGDVKDEAVKLVQYIREPMEEAAGLRSLLFVQFLGGSIASALVNMTQPITMTLPYLSRWGAARAAREISRAYSVAVARQLPAGALGQAMQRAIDAGILEPHEIHMLYAESDRALTGNPAVRKLAFAWGALFSMAEALNRKATFVAAWRMASTMTPEQLRQSKASSVYQFATKAVHETQGIYSKANRPNWARGAIGATLLTFKQYTIAYLEMFRRMPRQQKVLMLAVLVLLSGVQGLPFAEDLDDLIDAVGQSLGYNTQSRLWKQDRLKAVFEGLGADEALQRRLTAFVMEGVSAIPGAPLDVQGRLSMGNIIPGTGMLKPYGEANARAALEVLGPVGSLGRQYLDAGKALARGDPLKAAEAAAPVAVQNFLKGVDIAATGMYRDREGRRVTDADKIDAVSKAIGFQPREVAEVQRTSRAAQQIVNLARAREDALAGKMAEAIFLNKDDDLEAAIKELDRWNERNPEAPIRITAQQLRGRVRAMTEDRETRVLRAAPREVRGLVRDRLRQGSSDAEATAQ